MTQPQQQQQQEPDPPPPPPPLPRLKKQGLPLWVFRLIRILLRLCPFDAYVAFPLLILMVIAALGFVAGVIRTEERNITIFAIIGVCAVAIMLIWLHWARQYPRVPDEDDTVAIILVTSEEEASSWPAAPAAPVRGELIARGAPWFQDDKGRRVLLRGINLSAGTKLPSKPRSQQATHTGVEDFVKYEHVSFVGRPFPLEEAHVHLGRLRAMGLTFVRWLVTWEAVEHEGPGMYDTEYLEYLKAAVHKCEEYGMSLFIDFHQDVWSRWTGGDGAPAWTLEKVGFCLENLHASGAALTQQHWSSSSNDDEQSYPKMVWNSNNSRLAAGTMWTLFFAGNDFAPRTLMDGGEPVQEYLQRHFLASMGKVAAAVKDCRAVVGFDILNEPSVGFVGIQDARDIGPNMYYVGWRVDPWSAMRLGAGETVSVHYFSSFMYHDGTRKLNEQQVCAWTNGPESCVWHQNGVWEMRNGKPALLKPFYFATNPVTGEKIDFLRDYGIPFWLKAAKTVRAEIPDAIIFAEPILDMTDPSKEQMPVLTEEQVGPGYCYAPHYYDGMTLMTKSFSRYLGMDSVTQRPSISMRMIEQSYGKGISKLMHEAQHMGPGGCPVLIGECGIPFDMGGKDGRKSLFFSHHGHHAAFETGDFTVCTSALNRTLSALDHAKVSYTIWCYQQDNTNKYGDGWNGEDLSLFSKDQILPGREDDLFAGGRSLSAAIRPYPCRVAGDVIRFSFQLYHKDRRFDLVFRPDLSLSTRETIVFLPKYQYPHGANVHITHGRGTYKVDWDAQMLTLTHDEECEEHGNLLPPLPGERDTVHLVVTKVLKKDAPSQAVDENQDLELDSVA